MEFNECFISLVYGWVLYYDMILEFFICIFYVIFSVLFFIKVYSLLLVGLIEE